MVVAHSIKQDETQVQCCRPAETDALRGRDSPCQLNAPGVELRDFRGGTLQSRKGRNSGKGSAVEPKRRFDIWVPHETVLTYGRMAGHHTPEPKVLKASS
jgi:hypothetical protein